MKSFKSTAEDTESTEVLFKELLLSVLSGERTFRNRELSSRVTIFTGIQGVG
jgi:hypothetical protein